MMRYLSVILMFCAGMAHAVELGVIHNTYKNSSLDLDAPSAHFKMGRSIYGWASYETPNVRLVGQRIGGVDVVGFGVGLQRSYGDLRPFIVIGYFHPKSSTTPVIRHEAVVTELNNHHGWRGNRHFEESEYNVDAVYGGRVGLMLDFSKYLSAGASYRFLQLDEQLQAYTGSCDWPPTKMCKSWWVENRKLDMSAMQIGIYGRF